jgi:hypothetical protein
MFTVKWSRPSNMKCPSGFGPCDHNRLGMPNCGPNASFCLGRCFYPLVRSLCSAICRNRSFFGKFFSHTTAPLPRCLRRYAPTPTRRYGRHLWLRLRCAMPLRPPASLRDTLRVAKWLELREALRAGLCVRFSGVFARDLVTFGALA